MAVLGSGTVACKKDKDNTPEPTPPPVVQKLREFKNGEEFIRFNYNAAGEVNQVTVNSDLNTGGIPTVYTVNYDAAKRLSSLESTGEKIVAVYENNVLSRADFFEADQRIGYTNYQFENGLIKRATLYFGEDNDYQPYLEFNFTHNAAGNITEMVTLTASGVPGQLVRAGHVTYQYDQKTNPRYQQRDLLAMFWQSANKNNITIEDHFDSDLQPEDRFAYNYQYNDKGLPKSAVVTQGPPGQPPVTTNQSYTYQ